MLRFRSLGNDQSELGADEIRARMALLATECGCGAGGVFLVCAAVLSGTYFVVVGSVDLRTGLVACAFIGVSAAIGKLVGLGIARLKLLLLSRTLSRLSPETR